MRYLTILIILSVRLLAQGFGMPGSCTPDAVTLQESFGDGGKLCWASGPTSCNNTWTIVNGAAQSIAATPGSPPLYTACKNSLKMTTLAATQAYMSNILPTAIPVGATFDITFTLDVTANAMAAFDFTSLMVPVNDANGATGPGIMYFKCSAGSCTTTQLQVLATVNSAAVTITTSAWHTIKIHYQSGSLASYFTVDGGSQNTFTENAQSVAYIGIGQNGSSNLDAMTYYIGNVFVNANAAPSCAVPQAFTDFEASTNGTTSTAALLNASTHFGNGTWSGSSVSQLTFQSTAQQALLNSIDVCGTQYTGSGSLGLQFQIASGSALFYTYTWLTTSKTASAGIWFRTSLPATNTDFISVPLLIGGAGGVDYAQIEEQGTGSQLQVHMETSSGNHGSVNISPNTWYWGTLQYVAGGTHSMAIYDTSGTQVGSTVTFAATGNANPINIELGRSGSEAGAPAATFWMDDLKMDYVTGIFPLLP